MMSQGLVSLLEDDESIRRALSQLFESIGLDVKTFADARDFLSEDSPDCHPSCLLLDLRLPGMSGLALQEELKRRGATIPIIFITGHGGRSPADSRGTAASSVSDSRWDQLETVMTTSRELSATLEFELIDRHSFRSKLEARLAVFDYIGGFYNPHRRHSSLHYLSPINYELER